ncbi:Uncharacterised protein [Segatella copri]|nr:Uncharacterised protein [Segatella copri]
MQQCIGAFSCCFLKIISKMFDGFEEKYYLCRRNDDIELRLCAAVSSVKAGAVILCDVISVPDG